MYLPRASNLSLSLHKNCDQAILPLPFPLCAFLPPPLPRPLPRHPISAGYKKCILKLQGATISLISASKAQNLHIYPFEQLQRFISLCRFNSTFLQKKFAFVRRQGSTLLVWFCLGAKPYMTTIHECKNNASVFLNLSTIQPNIVDYKRRKGFARHTQTRAWKHAQVGQGLHKVSTDSSTAGSPTVAGHWHGSFFGRRGGGKAGMVN